MSYGFIIFIMTEFYKIAMSNFLGGSKIDLFDYMRDKNMKKESPLASRLRPITLEEVVGKNILLKGQATLSCY